MTGELPRHRDKLREAFYMLGNDIALAHAKDLNHDGEAGQLGAGQGVMDYRLYLSLLQQSGFDGAIILHQMHHLSDERSIRFCLCKTGGACRLPHIAASEPQLAAQPWKGQGVSHTTDPDPATEEVEPAW